MKYLNLTVENFMDKLEKTVNNLMYVRGCEEYIIKGWIYWNRNNPILYDEKKDNTEEVEFVFERMNHGLWLYVEENILNVNYGYCEADVTLTYDFVKLKQFVVRWLLKRWNLPIELKRNANGELSDESYETVMRVHPSIMKYFMNRFEGTLFLSEEDRNKIAKQSAMLFHPKSKGVSNPHEAISMYCTFSGFWEKFGLNFFDMQRLPHDVYMKLKAVISTEINVKSAEFENSKRQAERAKSVARRR